MGKKYKCPYCEKREERAKLITHVNRSHSEMIPEGFTADRVVYNSVNKVDHGKCRVCGKPTKWNQKAGRYDVLCGDPKCKEHMREEYKKNMLRVRGTYNILNDPEQQTKMLANRKISGTYKFTDGGVLTYTGTYEKKCLEFMDVVMQIPSKDIMSPGPTIEYEYNGEKHFYITDFYYIPYNLIIEVKDGGDNLNTKDSSSMRASREKTIAKENIITDRGEYNYIRLTNNNFAQLLEVFMDIKLKLLEGDPSKTYKINEAYFIESSDKSTINKNFKSKKIDFQYQTLSLKDKRCYKYLDKITSKNNWYWKNVKDEDSYIEYFVKGKDNEPRDGELLINKANDELVGWFYVETRTHFLAIEIPNKKYRGYGLGKLMLNDAIKKYGCRELYVTKDNKVAIKMYKDRGFEIVGDRFDGEYWHMKLPSNRINESAVLEEQAYSIPKLTSQVKKIHDKTVKDNKDPVGNQNCMLCTWCLEAWFRGIDVLPRGVYSPSDIIFVEDNDLHGYSIVKYPTKERFLTKRQLIQKVKDAGDGARYHIHVNWSDSDGGHEFMLINVNNRIFSVDPQAGTINNLESIKLDGEINFGNSYITRLDNREFNSDTLKYNDKKYAKELSKEDVKWMRDNGWLSEEDIKWAIKNKYLSESARVPVCTLTSNGTGAIHPALKVFATAMEMKYDTHIRSIEIIYLRSYMALANTIDKYEGRYQFKNSFMVRVDNKIYVVDPATYREGESSIYYSVLRWQICNIMLSEYDNITNTRTLDGISMYESGIKDTYYRFTDKQAKTLRKVEELVDTRGYKWLVPIVQSKKALIEVALRESVNFIDNADLYYNKKAFDIGDINLCFITGFSGSGKTTMASSMARTTVDVFDMDDVISNWNFSDENLEEYGDLIASFFKGPGKKYRYHSYDDWENDKCSTEYERGLTKDFVKYAMTYAKRHKNKKYVLEGIWIFKFINPSELDNYAVFIKGTSKLKSAMRAASRDNESIKGKVKQFFYNRNRYNDDATELETFRKHFANKITND